jgi:hypothetical protein
MGAREDEIAAHNRATHETLWFLCDTFKKYNDAREHRRRKAFTWKHTGRRYNS